MPPLLVQRALVLGVCRQQAEGQVGKASSLDSDNRFTDVIHVQSNSCETGPRPRRRGNAYFQRTVPCILCDVYYTWRTLNVTFIQYDAHLIRRTLNITYIQCDVHSM